MNGRIMLVVVGLLVSNVFLGSMKKIAAPVKSKASSSSLGSAVPKKTFNVPYSTPKSINPLSSKTSLAKFAGAEKKVASSPSMSKAINPSNPKASSATLIQREDVGRGLTSLTGKPQKTLVSKKAAEADFIKRISGKGMPITKGSSSKLIQRGDAGKSVSSLSGKSYNKLYNTKATERAVTKAISEKNFATKSQKMADAKAAAARSQGANFKR